MTKYGVRKNGCLLGNLKFMNFCIALFTSGLPVSTLAEAMFLDAWDYHIKCQSTQPPGREGATAAAPEDSKTIDIFHDSDIYQIYSK